MWPITALFVCLALAHTIDSTPIATQFDDPLLDSEPGFSESNVTGDKNNHEHETTSNWAGAVLRGLDFQTVTGTFTVPELNLPDGHRSQGRYAASAWVGIDGNTCRGVVMQTGVNMNILNGQLKYEASFFMT